MSEHPAFGIIRNLLADPSKATLTPEVVEAIRFLSDTNYRRSQDYLFMNRAFLLLYGSSSDAPLEVVRDRKTDTYTAIANGVTVKARSPVRAIERLCLRLLHGPGPAPEDSWTPTWATAPDYDALRDDEPLGGQA